MAKYSTLEGPAFRSCFVGRFDGDVIDPDDVEQVRRHVKSVGACLVSKPGLDLTALITDIENFLNYWDRDTILMLTDWTNLEWGDTPEMESSLRHILEAIASELRQRIRSRPRRIVEIDPER